MGIFVCSFIIQRRRIRKNLSIERDQFRVAINTLLEEWMIDVMSRGRSTRYVLKTSLSEYSYSIKRLLRLVEDDLIERN